MRWVVCKLEQGNEQLKSYVKQYYVVHALLVEIVSNKQRTHCHTHYAVYVRHAVLPTLSLLSFPVQKGVQVLLEILKTLIEIVQTVPDKAPHQIV